MTSQSVQPNPRISELNRWMSVAARNNHNLTVKPDRTDDLWLESPWEEIALRQIHQNFLDQVTEALGG